ncbi:hypothetical protein A3740_03440 [Oleiphilus sp. HI0068]|nr:hypothetical protein A3735_09850 [Oleiphilus sp. HI0061]KZY73383.1 hypothetical protein A3740_03440 [Oleiphilus sp. HI0068]KZY77218.1 hypothetical protein A3741_10065 [Oleiphilus sp. HI0069]KZY89467.1 hypothetical protein A3743_08305 [Oleiphilus sp. HI0072]KZZ80394.1 hypothetical protein A3766_08860 [Oleiphilus sp. HI0132]
MSRVDDRILHGGDLETASKCYGVPIEKWIDLSTGISPMHYPDVDISTEYLTRMPYQKDNFRSAVRGYYGQHDFFATNGSQQTIASLPKCLKNFPIVLPDIGYQEHAEAWRQHGAELVYYPSNNVDDAKKVIEKRLASGDAFHLLVINPNNPTCITFSPETLKYWSSQLTEGAALIVDEAFADLCPEQSVLGANFAANMVVLRSFGKFFGLPGLRLGFVFAGQTLLHEMKAFIGVWDVNGPAQEIATRAFLDAQWQADARQRYLDLSRDNQKLWQGLFIQLREQGGDVSEAHQLLFSTYTLEDEKAKRLFEVFAQHGVLLRLIKIGKGHSLIRIGFVDIQNVQQVTELNHKIKQSMHALKKYFAGTANDIQMERQYG